MGKIKHINLKCDNGVTYQIKAHDVAHDRANYYAKKENETTYEEEYNYAISDEDELYDWLVSNMNWWELKPVAIKTDELDFSELEIDEITYE